MKGGQFSLHREEIRCMIAEENRGRGRDEDWRII